MQTKLKKIALHKQYKKMVQARLRKPGGCYLKLRENKESNGIAEQLSSPLLASIFIEAQFHAMPVEWCKEKFNKCYPPYNVCFGGDCWSRYKTYVERGVRDAT